MSAALLAPNDALAERLITLVLDTLSSPESKRAYRRGLREFIASCHSQAAPFTKATVNAYRAQLEAKGLSPSAVNVALAAIRKFAVEAADAGLLAPEVAAAISRVKGVRRLGTRTGKWLTREEAEEILAAPADTMKGCRDRALLAVLIGCGLRRMEAAALTVEHIQMREARWVIVDMLGKGGRIRTVTMPSWAKAAIDAWTARAGITTGPVFRSVAKGGKGTGESITPQAIFEVVQEYGGLIGVPGLAPHDLRRTFARLARKGGAALEQIQLALGHESIQTTEKYLGVRQNLTDAPCDHLGLTAGVEKS